MSRSSTARNKLMMGAFTTVGPATQVAGGYELKFSSLLSQEPLSLVLSRKTQLEDKRK